MPSAGKRTEVLFTTTHWSMVLSARDEADEGAMEELCRTYWRTLYVLARHFGKPPHDAEDLVQGFFARLLEKDWLKAAGPERGRFRTFLSVVFRRYMADEYDHANRQKRGGGATLLSLDTEDAESFFAGELSTIESPEHVFDKAWALDVVASAQARLRRECQAAGREALCDAIFNGEPYAEIGARLGFNVRAVYSSAFRMRRRCEELIRSEIARTVADPREADDEITHLRAMLRG
jgi:RNA polymerase sigma factor (sigma-70 family)